MVYYSHYKKIVVRLGPKVYRVALLKGDDCFLHAALRTKTVASSPVTLKFWFLVYDIHLCHRDAKGSFNRFGNISLGCCRVHFKQIFITS